MKTCREGAGKHRYRVTVEHLYTPHTEDPLDPPLVFETSNQDALMLLFLVNRLRGGPSVEEDVLVINARPERRGSTRPM
jgi:hypothetical protein